MHKNIFIFSLILVFVINITIVTLYFNPIYVGWLVNSAYIIGLVSMLPFIYKRGRKVEWLYIAVLLLGLLFHSFLPYNSRYTINDSFRWIFLVTLIIASRTYRVPKFVFYTLITFLVLQCVLAIIENRLQTNLFESYSFVERSYENIEKKEFRSYAFMVHPLSSANITLIILSFILISKEINVVLKKALLILGSLAMLSYNSRTALIIWGCLLAYRYLFYNLKPIYVVGFGVLFYLLFLNDTIAFIQQNASIFGRIAAKNGLVDESSITRLMSFFFFWNARWNFQDILFGGRIIYLPGTELSLENGFLLTIAWWGWVVGPLKVILELVISYTCLKKYAVKERIMIMIACWGTAFSNNNTVNTFVFAFFIISVLSFNSLTLNSKVYNFKNIKITKNYR